MAKVARMKHHRAVRTRTYPIDVILKEIRTGQTTVIDSDAAELAGGRTLSYATEYARRLLSDGNRPAYDEVKKSLPAFSPAGYSSDGSREIDTLTGRVCLEWDDLDDPAWAFSVLAQSPYTFAAWYSLSGGGLKALFKVEPIPTPETFTEAWYAAVVEFEEIGEPDITSSRHSQPQGLVFCPQLYQNPNAQVIEYDPELRDFHEASPQAHTDADFAALAELPSEYQALLVDLEFDENGKCPTRVPCPSTHHEHDSFENLRANATVVSRRDDGALHFHCFKCGKTKVYSRDGKRTQRRPVKLSKRIVSVLTETIDKSRAFLKSVFENKKIKFFGLRADTGVGKTEGFITFLMSGFRGLLTVPTTDLAKELERRLDAAEVAGVFRYRGILSNPDGVFPDENPCIHAVRFDAIASRGWNAYELLCEQCEVRAVCEERGYRSQAERAKQAQVTVMPFPSVFLDPAFRTVAKDYVPTYHDDLILHDEFDPCNFLEINVPKSRLVQMRDDWKCAEAVPVDGADLGLGTVAQVFEGLEVLSVEKRWTPATFAKELLRILEVESDLSLLRPLVMGVTDAERASLLEGVTCVMWNGQILSREDAHRCHTFRAKMHDTEQVLTLPRLETEDWNLIVQLELFFQRYPRDSDMPMKYENDTLTFYLPPLPLKTRARMGFMSATLNETMFRRAMDNRQIKRGDVSFHDTGLTAWHPEAKVYQLRTNRNPRATVFAPKTQQASAGEGERRVGVGGWNASETERQTMPADSDGLLAPTGEDYWGLVAEDLKNENRGLISYKALLEEKASELEGVPTANFGGLVGLDTHFTDVEVLHVLFSPELPPSAVEFKAKMLYGNDTEPLCYDRNENGHYTDARLQACYDDGVIAELQQAIGRGRLVSRRVAVVVWCSHSLPGITDRGQTFLFDETDWQVAGGDIDKLQGVVAEREKAESSGDTQAYALATGQSERTARLHTAEKRKQSKAEQIETAKALRRQGKSYRQIAAVIGKAPNTIKGWCQK